ncbi:MAG TPA: iron transporter [Solirubrobacteraceae bacterium]|nr:iron transporter [Solirubrobacteraceae bacterium]
MSAPGGTVGRIAPLLAAGVLLAGCAKADKKEEAPAAASTSSSTTAAASSMSASMHMSGGSPAGSAGGSGTGGSAGGSGMAGTGGAGATSSDAKNMSVMGMEGGSKEAGMSVDGIKPVPMQTLGSADWEGMKITAQAMTAVPFVVYDGTHERLVKPGDASFHLMVFLSDAHTGVVIPYAGVWATIRKQGKLVFDARQWPMLSRYMGPHYGNDVTVPGAGTYELSLLISPPVSARHVEYRDVWLKPHRVSFTFHWKPV